MALASSQQEGLRRIGLLMWQLMILNTSVPVTKIKAALEFTQCLFDSHIQSEGKNVKKIVDICKNYHTTLYMTVVH